MSVGLRRRDDDGLEVHHGGTGGNQHLVAPVRAGGMPADAFQDDLEIVLRRHDRPDAGLEVSDRKARHVVQAIDLLERKPLHQPVGQHGERALAPFLGGLEDEAHGAVETALLGEELGRPEQHGGVAVMAAGVHRAGVLRTVGLRSLFGDAQGVHVGPERNRSVAAAAFQRADDARAADALGHLVEAELPQLGGDEGARALLLEAELWMGVQIAPPGGHFPFESVQIRGHGVLLIRLRGERRRHACSAANPDACYRSKRALAFPSMWGL